MCLRTWILETVYSKIILSLWFKFLQYTWSGTSNQYLSFRGSLFNSNRHCRSYPICTFDRKYTGNLGLFKLWGVQFSHMLNLVFNERVLTFGNRNRHTYNPLQFVLKRCGSKGVTLSSGCTIACFRRS